MDCLYYFGGEVKLPKTTGGEGSYEVTVNTHRRNETFVSNYNIEINKSCNLDFTGTYQDVRTRSDYCKVNKNNF